MKKLLLVVSALGSVLSQSCRAPLILRIAALDEWSATIGGTIFFGPKANDAFIAPAKSVDRIQDVKLWIDRGTITMGITVTSRTNNANGFIASLSYNGRPVPNSGTGSANSIWRFTESTVQASGQWRTSATFDDSNWLRGNQNAACTAVVPTTNNEGFNYTDFVSANGGGLDARWVGPNNCAKRTIIYYRLTVNLANLFAANPCFSNTDLRAAYTSQHPFVGYTLGLPTPQTKVLNMRFAVDNEYEVYFDGKAVAGPRNGDYPGFPYDWSRIADIDFNVVPGRRLLAFHAKDYGVLRGFIAALTYDGSIFAVSDGLAQWKIISSRTPPAAGWNTDLNFNDAGWSAVTTNFVCTDQSPWGPTQKIVAAQGGCPQWMWLPNCRSDSTNTDVYIRFVMDLANVENRPLLPCPVRLVGSSTAATSSSTSSSSNSSSSSSSLSSTRLTTASTTSSSVLSTTLSRSTTAEAPRATSTSSTSSSTSTTSTVPAPVTSTASSISSLIASTTVPVPVTTTASSSSSSVVSSTTSSSSTTASSSSSSVSTTTSSEHLSTTTGVLTSASSSSSSATTTESISSSAAPVTSHVPSVVLTTESSSSSAGSTSTHVSSAVPASTTAAITTAVSSSSYSAAGPETTPVSSSSSLPITTEASSSVAPVTTTEVTSSSSSSSSEAPVTTEVASSSSSSSSEAPVTTEVASSSSSSSSEAPVTTEVASSSSSSSSEAPVTTESYTSSETETSSEAQSSTEVETSETSSSQTRSSSTSSASETEEIYYGDVRSVSSRTSSSSSSSSRSSSETAQETVYYEEDESPANGGGNGQNSRQNPQEIVQNQQNQVNAITGTAAAGSLIPVALIGAAIGFLVFRRAQQSRTFDEMVAKNMGIGMINPLYNDQSAFNENPLFLHPGEKTERRDFDV